MENTAHPNKKSDYVTIIYNDLKAKIISGELKHGERLIEISTAEAYGASRLYTKEAFRLLEAERLVKHIPHRGYFVRGITSDMINEIVEIRQALEKVVFKEIIATASDEELNRLANRAKRFEVFVKNDMIEDAHDELSILYDTVYSMSKYRRIIKILTQYSDYIDMIRKMTVMTKENLEDGIENFNQLAAALVARNLVEVERQLDQRHEYLKANNTNLPS